MYSYPFFNNQQQILPQQQIIQVNGKASVDSIQLAPNSSILVLDTTAPIVWMCVSDGVGRVTSTPYDISVHVETMPETHTVDVMPEYDSEFGRCACGVDVRALMGILSEHMDVVKILYPKEYQAVLDRIAEIP